MNAYTASPFAPRRAAGLAQAYHRVGVETGVDAATPHALIQMLYDGLAGALQRARGALRAGDVAGKGQAIGQAIRILDEGLRGGLDRQAGGPLALQLEALYDYMSRRLLQANLHSDEAGLDEVQGLLQPLREAWAGIAPAAPAAAPSSPALRLARAA